MISKSLSAEINT